MTPERVAETRAYRAKGLAPLRSDMDDLLDAYETLTAQVGDLREALVKIKLVGESVAVVAIAEQAINASAET